MLDFPSDPFHIFSCWVAAASVSQSGASESADREKNCSEFGCNTQNSTEASWPAMIITVVE